MPRVTCILCDNALLKAFLRGATTITEDLITEVRQEMGTAAPATPAAKVGRPRKQRKEAYVKAA